MAYIYRERYPHVDNPKYTLTWKSVFIWNITKKTHIRRCCCSE